MFQDRRDAGIRLAQALAAYHGQDVIVLALPRGGVVLGAEIARRLNAPLDLVITKKIGHPRDPEYAIGALAEDGDPICDPAEIDRIDPIWYAQEVERIRREIRRRRMTYLGDATPRDLTDKVVILVDDGVATGLTMLAAIAQVRQRNLRKLIVAIPVTPPDIAKKLETLADELVSLNIDAGYRGSVSAYYIHFPQVEDQEVLECLLAATRSAD